MNHACGNCDPDSNEMGVSSQVKPIAMCDHSKAKWKRFLLEPFDFGSEWTGGSSSSNPPQSGDGWQNWAVLSQEHIRADAINSQTIEGNHDKCGKEVTCLACDAAPASRALRSRRGGRRAKCLAPAATAGEAVQSQPHVPLSRRLEVGRGQVALSLRPRRADPIYKCT